MVTTTTIPGETPGFIIGPASSKLQLSRLDQLEGMSPDIDLAAFNLEMRNKAGIQLVTAITDATIERTIEGASTLTVNLDDDLERTIQRSRRLGRKVDVNIDGLWFTLVGVKKQGARGVVLVFEEREVNVLRYYNKFIKANRAKVTRAQFILRMIEEVTEFKIPWRIPELKVKEKISDLQPGQKLYSGSGASVIPSTDPAQNNLNRAPGIPTIANLPVKGQPATAEQIQNANVVIETGLRMGARRKVIVVAVMTAIQESDLINLPGGDRDSHGLLQQRPSQGWNSSNDPAVQAGEFYQHAIPADALYPNMSYNDLAQYVQHSGFPNAYGQWQTEADNIVTEYGLTGGDLVGDPAVNNNMRPTFAPQGGYEFTRGRLSQSSSGVTVITPENSWQCIQRLAQEVNWKAFFVSGTFYYLSTQYLFRSKPYMVISEDSDGIDTIEYDYDEGKKVAVVTVTAHLGRWSAPPGSIIKIIDQGIIDGRWIVNDVQRSIFNTIATITLKKPDPLLLEPVSDSAAKIAGGGGVPTTGGARDGGGGTVAPNIVAQTAVQYATNQLGTPYVFGGETPGVGFDCSGLTQAAYGAAGVPIQRVAQAQYDTTAKLSSAQILLPGDLVFFSDTGSVSDISHVGIYIGGGRMIDAYDTGSDVRIDANFMSWTKPIYVGATRPYTNIGK